MHVSNKLLIVLGFLSATFFGCSDKALNQDSATVDVAFKIVADAKSDFAAVASTAEVKISAEGMPTMTQPLTVTAGGISGTITGIVAGPNRKFEVFVYDAANKLCYYGSSVGEVTVGGTANIAMTLYRTNGEGNAVINGTIQSTNIPPTVSLTSPANNAQFTLGTAISLAATAADADGSVSSVTFYSGSTLIATDNSTPYSCNYTPSATGTYSLTAVATDNAGASTTSTAVTVTIISGSVTLVYEAESAALTPSAAKNTNHTGYSGTGFVDGFYNSTTAKVVFTITIPSTGSYTLTTRYSAGNGNSSNTGLYINNTKIKNITCNKTTNWDTWANQNETVTLNAGSNTIGYKAESSSGTCINIDKITITGSAPTIYTITYNLNGGTNNASNPATYTSSSSTITLGAPVRTGYVFAGWYDNSSFTGTIVTTIPTGSTGNREFWAKWNSIQYTVGFVTNGGTAVASQTVNYGGTLTAPVSTRSWLTLAEWCTDAGLSTTWDFSSPVTSAMTLYAKWLVMDVDGNVYDTIRIGTQTWMVQNLKTTRYRDGTSIPLMIDATQWANRTTAAFCWPNNVVGDGLIYGAIYNSYVARTTTIAPAGWHVPTQAEFETLVNYVSSTYSAGGNPTPSLMAVGSYAGATNTSGFTGKFAPYRLASGFAHIGQTCWYTQTYSAGSGQVSFMFSDNGISPMAVPGFGGDVVGYSIRCIKD